MHSLNSTRIHLPLIGTMDLFGFFFKPVFSCKMWQLHLSRMLPYHCASSRWPLVQEQSASHPCCWVGKLSDTKVLCVPWGDEIGKRFNLLPCFYTQNSVKKDPTWLARAAHPKSVVGREACIGTAKQRPLGLLAGNVQAVLSMVPAGWKWLGIMDISITVRICLPNLQSGFPVS